MAIAHGVGTTVSIGNAITYVESVTAGGGLETAEVRGLDQTTVQRVAGLIDKGSIEITGYADNTNFAALLAARNGATAVPCTVTGTDGSVVSLNGFVTDVKLIASASEDVKFSATILADGR